MTADHAGRSAAGASGGTAPLSYSFTEDCLPNGVTEADGTISGTPTAEWSERKCTWTVADSDANTAASDTGTVTFTIEVKSAPDPDPDTAPVFEENVPNQAWWVDQSITPVELPKGAAATGACRIRCRTAFPRA